MTGKRILGVARLSRDTDESTSIERQTEHLRGYAASRGAELVDIAIDVDVSGAVSPFKRPGLGGWLTDERAHEYEMICAYRLDRLARSVSGFATLVEWAQARNIDIVTIDDHVDLSGPTGRAMAAMIAVFSELEREAIRARVVDSIRHLTAQGRYRGGTYPDGYMPVKAVDGWRLVHDPERVELIRDIVSRVIGGRSLTAIATDLDERGVLSPKSYRQQRAGKPATGNGWTATGIMGMLRSRALLGETTRVEKDASGRRVERVVRGADGLPITRGEPILSAGQFDELQAVLDRISLTPTRSRQVSPLGGVLFCGVCEAPFYPVSPDARKRSMRYRCKSETAKVNGARQWCGNRSILASMADHLINVVIMEELGEEPIIERRFIPGEDHSEELERVERAIRDLRDDRDAGLFVGERDAAEYRARMAALVAKRAELEKLPNRPARWEDVDTGETFWLRWPAIAAGPVEARREFLLSSGLRFYVHGKIGTTGRVIKVRRVPPGPTVTAGGILLPPEEGS